MDINKEKPNWNQVTEKYINMHDQRGGKKNPQETDDLAKIYFETWNLHE